MKVVLCYQAEIHHLEQLRAAFPAHEFQLTSQDEVAEALLEADIFCGHAKVPVDWPEVVSAGRLKWIQSSAAGLDHCLHPSIVESKVVVSGCSGLFARQVAETCLALLLGLTRRLYEFVPARQRREFNRLPTDDLRRRKIGLLGIGGNGREIARVVRNAFGCEVVGTDVFANDPDAASAFTDVFRVYSPDEFPTMLQQVDTLVVTAPLTGNTRNLVNRSAIENMIPGGYLVNVGRGEIVEESALVEALQDGRLQAAGLDVTHPEPPASRSPLWDLPNVLLTPHIGAQCQSRIDDVTELFASNLRRYGSGKALVNLVDKGLGFPRPQDRWCPDERKLTRIRELT